VKYGSSDVLQLKDIDKPVVKDDEVLVRVCAAAVNIGDWHLLRGVPYAMRLASGLLKPRREIPGLDVVGQVEVTGKTWSSFGPGTRFSAGAGAPSPSMRVLRRTTSCPGQPTSRLSKRPPLETLPSPPSLRFAIKARCSRGGHGVDQRCVGRRRNVRRADREGVRSERDRCLQHQECRHGLRSIGADQVIDYTKEDFTQAGQRYDVMLDLVGSRSLSACTPKGKIVIAG
jgi:NADPH:quinone reductase-like Zn-dependent oxidoreductase